MPSSSRASLWTPRTSTGAPPWCACGPAAGPSAEYDSFESVQEQLLAATIRFDPQAVSPEYRSPRWGRLGVDADGGRFLDGRPADLDYPTWDSLYLQSAWDSGLAELSKGWPAIGAGLPRVASLAQQRAKGRDSSRHG